MTVQNVFNYFRPADSVKAGGYFFYAGKTLYWVVRGVFPGDQDFFDLLIVPSVTIKCSYI